MSMIEKFLNAKDELRKDLDEVKEEMLAAASAKADKMIDGFIEYTKMLVAEASDEEFVEFITSGKLSDEDLNAVIMFRAKVRAEKQCEETYEQTDEKRGHNVHVIVL